MHRFTTICLLAVFTAFSCSAIADQSVDRLSIDYPSPFVRDSDSESAVKSLPSNARHLIESFKAYKAAPLEGLSNVNVMILKAAPSLSVRRDGYIGPITQMKNDPRVSELTYEPTDIIVSGYPAVRVKYKGKFNQELPIAGDILYIYDISTHTSWTVSVSYYGKDRSFSNFRKLANKSNTVLDSVEVR